MTMTGRFSIADQPNGEDTSLDGTEKFPVSGSKYALISSIQTYTRGLDNCYVILAGFGSNNPADATTYYFGCFAHASPSTTAAVNRLYIHRAGTIISSDIFMTGSTGTTETSTLSLRLNNASDTALSTAVALNTSPYHLQTTGLSIAVVAGDYVECKWVTPTWGTNPTAVVGCVTLFVK